jgi:hypothetical protein
MMKELKTNTNPELLREGRSKKKNMIIIHDVSQINHEGERADMRLKNIEADKYSFTNLPSFLDYLNRLGSNGLE